MIDPIERTAWTYNEHSAHQLDALTLTTKDGTESLPLGEIFAELDEPGG